MKVWGSILQGDLPHSHPADAAPAYSHAANALLGTVLRPAYLHFAMLAALAAMATQAMAPGVAGGPAAPAHTPLPVVVCQARGRLGASAAPAQAPLPVVVPPKVPATAPATDGAVAGASEQIMLLITHLPTLPAPAGLPGVLLVAQCPAAPALAAVPIMVKQAREFHGFMAGTAALPWRARAGINFWLRFLLQPVWPVQLSPPRLGMLSRLGVQMTSSCGIMPRPR
jgi:hypothetical protein